MPAFELAQLNIATMKAPLESPLMADFVANLDRINHLAETSPGYVWRLQTEEGNASTLRPFGPDIVVNLSVWQDLDALRGFVFRTDHVTIQRRRAEWFEPMDSAAFVFWWVPAGHRPSLQEARERLDHLREHGPTAHAFAFRQSFPPPQPSADSAPAPQQKDCPAL